MPKLKSVRLRGGFTVNLGNYETGNITAEVELEVEEGDTEQQVFEKARELLDNEIGYQMQSLKRLMKAKGGLNGRILDIVRVEQSEPTPPPPIVEDDYFDEDDPF